MGTFFFILGALMQTHPPDPNASHPSGASIAMAIMIYLYGMFDFFIPNYSLYANHIRWVVIPYCFCMCS